MIHDEVRERALGAYLGFAVGDALGATVEFMTPTEIQRAYGMHRDMIGGGWLKLKPGQIADDTQMALGQSLIDSGGWNATAAADAFVDWLKSRPVDVGIPGYWLKKLDKQIRRGIEAQTEALLRLAQNMKKDS